MERTLDMQVLSTGKRPCVVMLILNEVMSDARVIRAARTLSPHYKLTILGVDTQKIDFDHAATRQALGFDIEWIPMRLTGRLPRNIPGYFARYSEVIARMIARGCQLKPDIIHAHDCNSLPIALAIRAVTRAKIIYDAHELYRETTYARDLFFGFNMKAVVESIAMPQMTAIIACNQFRARIMRDEYGAPHLPYVVRNVPPYASYKPSALLRQFVSKQNSAVTQILLYQGCIMPGRGMETMIEAMHHLPGDVGLVFLGGGGAPYIESLRELSQELVIADRIFFHPKVPYDNLSSYTASADVGLVVYQNTCRNNYYCAPNKLYEYAAAGLPQVGSDLPPVREFFNEFGTGLTFPEGDASAMAQAVQTILSDPTRVNEYRRNCLAAAKVMCWENESQNLLQLYRDVIAGSLPHDAPSISRKA